MNRLTTPARRQLLVAAAAFALAAPAFAWNFGGDSVQGSGTISKQARQVAHFSGVELSVPGKVELHIGSGEGVTIEADDNLLPLIETTVDNGTLRIRPARDNLHLRAHTLHITVNARDIDHLSVGGSGSIDSDAVHARNFKASLGGSGSIAVRAVDGDNMEVSVAGSGKMSAGGGAVNMARLSIAGSGNVDIGKVKAGDVSVKVAGSGDSRVWAAKTLDVTIAGSGNVDYYGDARVSRTVLGSGDINHLGGAAR
ncbi:MAG: head GIN domain-containing protein [Telluria sp.]